jgi:hypothetical protein
MQMRTLVGKGYNNKSGGLRGEAASVLKAFREFEKRELESKHPRTSSK